MGNQKKQSSFFEYDKCLCSREYSTHYHIIISLLFSDSNRRYGVSSASTSGKGSPCFDNSGKSSPCLSEIGSDKHNDIKLSETENRGTANSSLIAVAGSVPKVPELNSCDTGGSSKFETVDSSRSTKSSNSSQSYVNDGSTDDPSSDVNKKESNISKSSESATSSINEIMDRMELEFLSKIFDKKKKCEINSNTIPTENNPLNHNTTTSSDCIPDIKNTKEISNVKPPYSAAVSKPKLVNLASKVLKSQPLTLNKSNNECLKRASKLSGQNQSGCQAFKDDHFVKFNSFKDENTKDISHGIQDKSLSKSQLNNSLKTVQMVQKQNLKKIPISSNKSSVSFENKSLQNRSKTMTDIHKKTSTQLSRTASIKSRSNSVMPVKDVIGNCKNHLNPNDTKSLNHQKHNSNRYAVGVKKTKDVNMKANKISDSVNILKVQDKSNCLNNSMQTKCEDGWLTVNRKRRPSSYLTMRFYQPSSSTSLPTLTFDSNDKPLDTHKNKIINLEYEYNGECYDTVSGLEANFSANPIVNSKLIRQKSDLTGLKTNNSHTSLEQNAHKESKIQLLKNRDENWSGSSTITIIGSDKTMSAETLVGDQYDHKNMSEIGDGEPAKVVKTRKGEQLQESSQHELLEKHNFDYINLSQLPKCPKASIIDSKPEASKVPKFSSLLSSQNKHNNKKIVSTDSVKRNPKSLNKVIMDQPLKSPKRVTQSLIEKKLSKAEQKTSEETRRTPVKRNSGKKTSSLTSLNTTCSEVKESSNNTSIPTKINIEKSQSCSQICRNVKNSQTPISKISTNQKNMQLHFRESSTSSCYTSQTSSPEKNFQYSINSEINSGSEHSKGNFDYGAETISGIYIFISIFFTY